MTEAEKQTLALLRAESRADRAEMMGKLDVLIERTSHLDKIAVDFENRVRSLERWKYGIPITAIGAFVAAAIGMIRLSSGT